MYHRFHADADPDHADEDKGRRGIALVASDGGGDDDE